MAGEHGVAVGRYAADPGPVSICDDVETAAALVREIPSLHLLDLDDNLRLSYFIDVLALKMMKFLPLIIIIDTSFYKAHYVSALG